jgi:hypothetical protein
MDEMLLNVVVQLDAGPGADAQEIEDLAARLRRRLLELDVQSVDRAHVGEPPPGTRAAEVLALGSLIVTMTKSADLLKSMLGVIHSIVAARPARTVEIMLGGDTLKLTGISSEEQDRPIDLFVTRHAS